MTDKFSEGFKRLVKFQDEAAAVLPAFESSYPVALVEDQQFLIYDRLQGEAAYELVKTTPVRISLPEGVMAAFPLDVYDGQMAAVVTPAVFESPDGLVMILHEFVHCYQFKTCSQDLQKQLTVAQDEEKCGHVTWEIDFPFPYTDEAFVNAYTDLLRALEIGENEMVARSRQTLREQLVLKDYEYMVWEEWLEGFARWIENRLREYADLPRNDNGAVPPYNRVSLYAGGSAYIDYLVNINQELQLDLRALFAEMFVGIT